MRVFQAIGIADAVAPYTEPFTPSEYYGVDGRMIRRMTMVAPPFPQGYTPSIVFTQPPVERILRARVAAMPNVTIALGTTLQALRQDGAGVTLSLVDARGTTSELRARYVIGCDGGASTTRACVDLPLEDLDFDEPWLVVDVRVNAQGLARLPKVSVQYCEPERPCTLVIGPGNHRRWEISLKPGEDPRQVETPAGTWALLARWIGPEHGELWRQASYRFHALVASEWRRGRVFLAGDAAHMQPPFLGQGMCQGVRDVANLSWKLLAVLRGEVAGDAGEALLDSYGVERKAHVCELTGRIKQIGAVICERDPDRARERDAKLLAECGGVVRDTPRQDVLPRLSSGMLASIDASARGTLFPQPRLRDGAAGTVLMDARFGCGWRLVGVPPLSQHLAEAAQSRAGLTVIALGTGTTHENEGVVADWMQRHGCRAALVRPDHYVFGCASDDAGLTRLLEDWHARLHGTGR